MKPKNRRKKMAIAILIILLCFLCYELAPFPVSYWTTPLDAPGYIESVWPPPDSQIWSGYYKMSLRNAVDISKQAGINVTLTPTIDIIQEERVLENSSRDPLPLLERMYLYVDGQKIPDQWKTTMETGPGMLPTHGIDGWKYFTVSARYSLWWKYPLSNGKHVVKFIVETASGKSLEYEWSFTVK